MKPDNRGFLGRLWPQKNEDAGTEARADPGIPRQDLEPADVEPADTRRADTAPPGQEPAQAVAGDTVLAVPRQEPATFTRIQPRLPPASANVRGRRPPPAPRKGSGAAWIVQQERRMVRKRARRSGSAKRKPAKASTGGRTRTRAKAHPKTAMKSPKGRAKRGGAKARKKR